MLDPIQQPTIESVLHSSTLLNSLTAEEMQTLARNSRMARAARGEAVWLHGSEVEFFGLVSLGFVKMVKGSASGHDAALEIMGPGQIFGMMGTIEGVGCPLTAIAVTELSYLKIPKTTFGPIYEANHAFKDRLIRRSSMRLHDKMNLLARLSSGRVEQRMATILFMLTDSYGEETPAGVRLQVPLTRQDLAELAGTSTETAIRVMSRWQKEGVVATESHIITLLDTDALQEVLDHSG
ncbi:MAG: Crp/Fnr family transcriptional regulator [Chthonomonadaceae bacterium]|nr:Crp/Fnr family transcriptional regulator [Chthonomonadaceae bacterium]